ncbi:BTB/POZ domain-containing protein 3-like [Mercenaria mercenaria]|uniref:BTB/POZ domain-containing protein 3-like n=1 Tax=Mercenaria mercenaria TaxID=6596 RepID=UPI00234E7E25|nr:BTB/POZ domain-containing protein 3-like [Mercenaria mercenaria]
METRRLSEDSEEMQSTSSLTEVNASTRRKNSGNLKDDTSNFCLSDRLADVWFSFKDSSTKLPAHKLLLSMRSEVFEAMFYGPLAESTHTITVEDIDITTMKMSLRYIYSDDVELDGKHVTGCLYVAKKYALHGLVDKCSQFLANAIAVGTACAIYEQAKVYDEFTLRAKCFDYIVENSKDVFLSEDFLTLSNESLLEILKSDNLSSDESLNFAALKRWAESDCRKKSLLLSPENIRRCLGDVLFMVRFPLMPIDTFAKEVAPTGILTYEEMLMMYHYLATKTGSLDNQSVGRFSCNKRHIVMGFGHLNISPAYQNCLIILNTSNPVQLVSVKGNFVQQVSRIHLSNTGRHKIPFDINDDRLDLCEPLTLKPEFGNIQIDFQMRNVEGIEPVWSQSSSISRTIRDVTVIVRRVPCGLKTLVFKEM